MNAINDKKLLAVCLVLWSSCAMGAGSVVFDNSLPGQSGVAQIVPLVGGTYTIPASHGYISGSGSALNLFQSFQTFDVDTNETALFTNDTSYASGNFANILSRVTGGTPTTINGTIDSTAFGNANFWFVNPSGVTIGSGAKIDVPAGLAIGSADYITFSNGDRWYAIDSNGTTANPSVLSTASPSAFGFLSNSGAHGLTIQAGLTSGPGGGITLAAGGPVSISAGIASGPTPSGQNGSISITSNTSTVSLSGSIDATAPEANPGAISIAGTGVLISGSELDASCPIACAGAGNITIQATGSSTEQSPQLNLTSATPGVVRIVDSTLNTNTTGGAATTALTGEYIVLSQAEITSNPPGSGQGGTVSIGNFAPTEVPTDGVWILNGSNISADSSKALEGGNPGLIQIQAGAVDGITVQGSTLTAGQGPLSSAPNQYDITLNSDSGTVVIEQNSTLSTAVEGNVGAGISVTGASVHVSDSTITTSATLGSISAGPILLEATAADPTGTAALRIDGSTSISSAASAASDRTPNGGTVTIKADVGTVDIGGPVTISTSADSSAGAAGVIGVSGDSVTLNGATLQTTVATLTRGLTPARISVSATTGSVSVTGSSLETLTVGNTDAGDISINASTTATLTGSTLNAQSQGAGNAGNISVSGSGVLISQQSWVQANYNNPGGNSGGPGSVTVFATGAAAANDPLNLELTSATPGVVRLVDSAVTATNIGGTGINGSMGGRGQVWIGADLPGASGTVSDNVVIAGSVVSNSVSAGGIGSNLTVDAKDGVVIMPSSSGGYPILPQGNLQGISDVRTSSAQSLLSSETGSTAISPGQIAILGGASGVSITQSTVDANDAYTGMNNGQPNATVSNIQISSTGGSVDLTASLITAQATGIDAGGNIGLSGQAVTVAGGEINASSDPITNLSEFSNYSGGNAGSIAITGSGGVQIGSGGSASPTTDTTITSTSTQGAAAGSINVTGSSVSIDPSLVSTSTSGTGAAGDIAISASSGPLKLVGADIQSQSTSAASDAGKAGSISLAGSPVIIEDGSDISASITGGVPQTTGSIPATPTANILIDPSGPNAGIDISGSTVTTQADVANGGDISILASSGPVMIESGSTVEASAGTRNGTAALGHGGNITIGPKQSAGGPTSIVVQGSQILAQADGGRGGAIYIEPASGDPYIQDVGSRVNADSNAGNNGTVTIKAPQTDLNSALKPAQVSAAKPPSLSADVCAPGVNRSTFVRGEKGGLAPAPDGYLSGGFSGGGSTTARASTVSGEEGRAPHQNATTRAAGLLAANTRCH